MSKVGDAFQTFKSRLEISKTEEDDASRRQKDVRATVQESFDVERDFLTGSYGRRTKTKPLKDVDIFVVLGDDDEVRFDHAVRMYEALPDGELAILPRSTHGLIVEKPDLLARVIRDFHAPDKANGVAPLRRHPDGHHGAGA